MRVVRDRIKPLLVSILFAMIAKSLMSSGFITTAWSVATISLLALGFRYISRFDPATNRYNAGWYLFEIPLKVYQTSLGDIEAVKVQHTVSRGKYLSSSDSDHPDHHYLIQLQGVTPHYVQLIRNSPLRARQLGEQLAKCIQCTLHDGSQGKVIRREAEELNMSLGQRMHHRGIKPRQAPLPNNSKIQVTHHGRGEQLVLPPNALPGFVLWIVVALFTLTFILLWFVLLISHVVLVAIVLPFMLYIIVSISSSYRPLRLWIDSGELRFRRFPYRGRMKMEELEEVFGRYDELTLISDKKILGLPYSFLDKKERQYVHALIEKAAVASFARL